MTEPRLGHLSAAEVADLIRARSISAEELLGACLARIEQREPAVRAWTFVDPERAVEKARQRDRETPIGPLHGVPVGLKDIIDTATMPTSYGTPIYADRRPRVDAGCVQLLDAAGAVVLGKTVTTELASFPPSVTRNPHHLDHTPGGSSSGSAAAVADRMVPIALGTQTVGSTIRPGSFCGVLSMKPTLHAVDLTRVRRTSERLDTIGIFGRAPADLRLQLEVLGGLRASRPEPSGPLRVALVQTPWWSRAGADSRAAIDRAASLLDAAGARIDPLVLPDEFGGIQEIHDVVTTFDCAVYNAREFDDDADQLSEKMRVEIERGRKISLDEYDEAVRGAAQCRRGFDALFADFDVVLAPAVTGEAPRGLDSTGDPVFCRPWSMLGVPAATVPTLSGASGLPVGVQLVGPRQGERAVLAAADQLFQGLGEEPVPLPPE